MLAGYIADQGLISGTDWSAAMVGTPAAAAKVLCSSFEAQEQSLLWCVLRYSRLVPGLQLERDLAGLVGVDGRGQLGQLPVFVTGLGAQMKGLEQRSRLMWAYGTFKPPHVSGRAVSHGAT
jgi:hypothetical protein